MSALKFEARAACAYFGTLLGERTRQPLTEAAATLAILAEWRARYYLSQQSEVA